MTNQLTGRRTRRVNTANATARNPKISFIIWAVDQER
jgi:hypothetical protein